MTATGGELIVKMLQIEGVEKVFGIIDGTYFGFYSQLAGYGIDLITPRHETTAAHMAGAYARLTGKLGVCIASNGPGVANILPGIAVENAEGNRVLVITSSRRSGIGYPDRGGTYQYFDQVGAIGTMAKWSGCAASFDRIPELMRRALRISYRGRPGVVHVDIPENIINGKFKGEDFWEPHQYRRPVSLRPDPDQIETAAALLSEAQLPLIHAGSGVIHAEAYSELLQLAELLHAPVTTSWSGRGVFPEPHPLAWPMVHVKACNEIRNAADVVLCLGSRLGETDWWGKAPNWRQPARQRLIQVDTDEEILGMNRPADVAVLADARLFLSRLIAQLKDKTAAQPLQARQQMVARLARERDKDRDQLDQKLEDLSAPLITAHVGKVCRKLLPDDAVMIFDGGNTAVWGNFYYQIRRPNTQLSTHHFGMLGAGLGQTLGACVARPDKRVCCIIGDGAFGFHPQEIETAVRNDLKPIFLVCSDKQWGMVKINQQFALKPVKTMIKKSLTADETINTDLGDIAFDVLAEAMGAKGLRAAGPAELEEVLKEALAANRCTVIHVEVDPVKHMWAPGLLHFKNMHQEPAGK